MSDVSSRLTVALSDRYRIERELGAGGMATVYLAEDIKHHRKVALKVLKPELAAVVGAERFLAEITVTANLQHPNILPLHDSGTADSFLFYVMPYVEGESLRDRLDREHQLPVDDAVQIAKNLADALDYAHRRGVIHRDIKPANVLLLDGKPVIADFGIALAVGVAGGGRLTETGLSLGTPHYMSPEQATGDAHVGPATDIYALGCVLYEMLVGEPPYVGSTAQAVLGKIIQGAPVSATEIRKSVPRNVDAAIRKALEKVPADRFGSAADFAKALADPTFRHGDAVGVAAGTDAMRWKRVSIITGSIAALATLAFVWALVALLRPEPRPVARFDITPGEGHVLVPGSTGVDVALSPDGTRMVYVGEATGGGRQLWQRALGDLEPVPIPGTEDAVGPAFSPDGLSVAFITGTSLKTVSLEGGPAFTVVPSDAFCCTADWGSDGMLYFRTGSGIKRVPSTGGEPEVVTTVASNTLPDALPDGRGLLFTTNTSEDADIAVLGPKGGAVRVLMQGTMARYARSGHIVYATADGTLMAAPFDLKSLEAGPSVALVQGVMNKIPASQFALSETGTLLYRRGSVGGRQYEFVWVTRSGGVSPVSPGETFTWGAGNRNDGMRLSPDGNRVAFTKETDGNVDIWTKDLPDGPMSRLTFDRAPDQLPSWTPDGQSITFGSQRGVDSATAGGQQWRLWTQPANGTGEAALTSGRPGSWAAEGVWSPDGTWLIIRRNDATQPGLRDVVALRPGVDSTATPLIAAGPFMEQHPVISRDGRWLAYTSNETGRDEVFVRTFPDVAKGKWQISQGGGAEPVWAHNGRELFFLDPATLEIEAAAFSATTGSFQRGRVTPLFKALNRLNASSRDYDVARDDSRFLMQRLVTSATPSKLILVQNFFEELRTRVGK